jgi:hypothetical protein
MRMAVESVILRISVARHRIIELARETPGTLLPPDMAGVSR